MNFNELFIIFGNQFPFYTLYINIKFLKVTPHIQELGDYGPPDNRWVRMKTLTWQGKDVAASVSRALPLLDEAAAALIVDSALLLEPADDQVAGGNGKQLALVLTG